jgi:MFS family permease
MNRAIENPVTHWRPVLAMALMQGAIIMCWVVYRLYLPGLLGEFGFPKAMVVVISAIEGFLTVLIEPLFGSLSDQYKTLIGLRAPFVTIGVLLTAALMIIMPGVILLGHPDSLIRWVFVAVVIIWTMAMAMFRTPMLARLGEFACKRDWPYAASILTLVGTMAGTLALPTATQIVKSMGAWTAFTVSSLILLLSATLLNKTQPPQASLPTIGAAADVKSSPRNLGLVALTGMTITLGIVLTRQLIGLAGKEQTPALTTLFLIVQLVTVLPIGWFSRKWDSLQIMMAGLGLLSIGFLILLAPLDMTKSVAMIFLGLGFSSVGVGTIPFALKMVPPSRSGLGIGVYFGGAALASSLFNLYMSSIGNLSFSGGFMVGLLSLLMAIGTLSISRSHL